MQFRKKRREKSPNISVDLTRLVVHVNGKQIKKKKKKKKKRKKDGEEERKKREKNNER